jgi:pimeloyl-ACP methyl ester carboxylesterase
MSSSEMTNTRDSLRPKPRLQYGLLTWIRRVLLKLLIALLTLAGIGAAYQAIATARDARTYPPPGRLVDVGGYKLHIYCTGPANTGNPTVILEAGLGAPTSAWAWIQPEVAQTTLVCSYDRAGMGWSDPSTGAQDAQQIARALHTLLTNSGLAGPYVLVGWSYGGLYARVFAAQYRSEVSGMVLIDSSHPDQCTSTPAGEAQCKTATRIYAAAPLLARLGVTRIMGRLQPASGLPSPQDDQLLASFAASKDWAAQSAEYLASPATNAQVRAVGTLGDLPLFVISATEHGTPPDLEQLWQGWQEEMASLSTNSRHRVVDGAGHTSLVFDAQDAQASIAAIEEIVAAARTGQPLH